MSEACTPSAIHMIVTIVDRGKGDKVVALSKEMNAPIHLVSLARGTARTEVLDLLGLGDTKKDTVIVTDGDRAQNGLVQQLLPPTYLGAIIVCEGGDRAEVRLAIAKAVSRYTGLGIDRISVLKMK